MSAVFEVPAKLAVLLQLLAGDPAAKGDALPPPVAAVERAEQRIEASGFAFSEDRWIEALHEHGPDAGQRHLSQRIFRTRSGIVYVPLDADRDAISAARSDPRIAVPIARAAAATHAEYLSWSLGRRVTDIELMLAHLAGHAEAGVLIETSSRTPQRAASEAAPRAALAHPGLFFDGTRARSSGEVVRHVAVALARARQRAGGEVRVPAPMPQAVSARPYKLGALEAITGGWRRSE